jgi:regulator of protease activity HflC (stomatin/prohibitin superfamily)
MEGTSLRSGQYNQATGLAKSAAGWQERPRSEGMKRYICLVLCIGLAGCTGCSNPKTQAGYVGYVIRTPIFGQQRFYGLQVGPASTGLGWMLSVTNVSVTPYTASELFQEDSSVLASDNLKVSFGSHLIFAVRPDRVRELVEKFNNGADNNGDWVWPAYTNYVKEPFRTIARDEVQKYKGLDIKDNIDPIGAAITKRLNTYLADTPFRVIQAVVGNIQYPKSVEEAVSSKLATTQLLEQKKTEVLITEMEAQKRVAEAHGIADAMAIINGQLTPLYLQHEAIQAQEKMVRSPNHTEIYIPTGAMGVPIVGTANLGGK